MALRGLLLALAFAASASAASAQVFGTFTWQMQPYCNRVTLTLTSVTGNFTLDGSDDQCGATTKASAIGIGVFNPNGTVGLNFTIVTSPGGKPVHVSAVVSPANGNGSWSDSVGNSGTFAFFGAVPGLPVRPLPASGLPAAIITNVEIAPGAVTGVSVADGSLTMADVSNGPRTASIGGDQNLVVTGTDATVRSLTMNLPSAGSVVVNASGDFRFSNTAGTEEYARCSITTGNTLDFDALIIASEFSTSSDAYESWAATRRYSVSAGSFTVNVVCDSISPTGVIVQDTNITAIFVAP